MMSSNSTASPPLPTVTGKHLITVFAIGGLGLIVLYFTYPLLVRQGALEWIAPARADIVAGFIAYAVFLAACWIFVVRTATNGWASVGLRRCDPSLFWIGGFLACLWIGVSSALYAALGIWELALAAGASLIAPFRDDPVAMTGLFILAGPMAALVEEILFRGLLYGWLRQRMGIAVSAIVSALLFTAAHFYVFVAGIAFAVEMAVLAVLLALLYELSRSLWPGILAHALNNVLLLTLYLYQG